MAKNDHMLGFADRSELTHYQMQDGAFYLGNIHKDHGTNFESGLLDDRGIFIKAGSRGGKGTTLIIPNLLRWEGGVFNIDPKGENASITACRRASAQACKGTGTSVTKHLGQKVAILDPLGVVRGAAKAFRVTYDPLSDIEIGTPQESDQIIGLIEGFVLDDQGGSGAHFTENVATIFAGAVEAILHKMPKGLHRLSSLVELMRQNLDEILAFLDDVETPAGLAQEAASVLSKVGDEEAGSFGSTASRQLKWLFDPRMKKHLQPSDFSLVQAVRENWTIYVCLPPSKIPRLKRWMRILTKTALDAKMDSPFDHEGQQSLFLLDEFNALGHFQIIEDAAGYMAGYGIKLVPVIQNIGQIKKHYEKNWETFLGNAGAIVGFALNDHETEQYLSDRMGKVMVWEESLSAGSSKQRGQLFASGSNVSKSASMRERAVRWPNEIHAQGARGHMRGFVIPSDSAPFTVKRANYWETFGADCFDSPDFIQEWERKHG